MQKARLLSFNPVTGDFNEIVCSELDDYYKALECDCFDITYRAVGPQKRCFDIFVDDIGLFREDAYPSALDNNFQPQLVGNMIFAHHDNEGNTTSLSDEDIEYIKGCKIRVNGINKGNSMFWYVIQPVDYPK